MVLLGQMIILFIIMAVGFACEKRGIIDDYSSKAISAIVINVANPALVLSAGMTSGEQVQLKDLGFTAILAVLLFAALILIAEIIPRLLGTPKKRYGTYRVMTVFSNIGFMGFPVIAATYGSTALLYASVFLFPFNLLIYTYGIAMIKSGVNEDEEGTKAEVVKSVAAHGAENQNAVATAKRHIQWGKVFNIGVIASIVSIVLYLSGIQFPSFITSAVSSLSSLTAPLSMMVIGYSIAKMNIKELFGNVRLLIFALIKLIAIPVIGILVIRLFVNNSELLGVCFIMLATPVGSMTAMLAKEYGGDEELASKGVAITTILSVITMPLVGMLLGV